MIVLWVQRSSRDSKQISANHFKFREARSRFQHPFLVWLINLQTPDPMLFISFESSLSVKNRMFLKQCDISQSLTIIWTESELITCKRKFKISIDGFLRVMWNLWSRMFAFQTPVETASVANCSGYFRVFYYFWNESLLCQPWFSFLFPKSFVSSRSKISFLLFGDGGFVTQVFIGIQKWNILPKVQQKSKWFICLWKF